MFAAQTICRAKVLSTTFNVLPISSYTSNPRIPIKNIFLSRRPCDLFMFNALITLDLTNVDTCSLRIAQGLFNFL